jgi:hypothetical protein
MIAPERLALNSAGHLRRIFCATSSRRIREFAFAFLVVRCGLGKISLRGANASGGGFCKAGIQRGYF